MNSSTMIAIVFAVGFYAVITAGVRRTQEMTGRSPLVIFRGGNAEEVIAGVFMFLFPLLLVVSSLFPNLRPFRTYFDSAAPRATAALILFGALALQAVSIATLGRAFRIGIDREHPGPLIRRGPYQYIRHPIYTALAAYFLGAWLLQPNLLFSIIAMLGVPRVVYQALREERALVGMFGEDYRSYMKATKRFIPGVV